MGGKEFKSRLAHSVAVAIMAYSNFESLLKVLLLLHSRVYKSSFENMFLSDEFLLIWLYIKMDVDQLPLLTQVVL